MDIIQGSTILKLAKEGDELVVSLLEPLKLKRLFRRKKEEEIFQKERRVALRGIDKKIAMIFTYTRKGVPGKKKRILWRTFINESELDSTMVLTEGMRLARLFFPTGTFFLQLEQQCFPNITREILISAGWEFIGVSETGIEMYSSDAYKIDI